MKNTDRSVIARSFRAAFPQTIPILAGFLFLGMAYGIYMNVQGFSFVYPMLMALVIFGGSLEFLAVEMLLSPFAPIQVLLVSLMIQARHLFYGISMLSKYRNMGWKKFYLIYTTSDETFSVNYSAVIPDTIDRGWFYFFVSLLDQLYWVIGATIGSLFGSLITIDLRGLDFVMTAMFTVIFLQQWLKDGTNPRTMLRDHISELIGILGSAACRLLFGPDRFMIPSMLVILTVLLIFRKPIEKNIDGKEARS